MHFALRKAPHRHLWLKCKRWIRRLPKKKLQAEKTSLCVDASAHCTLHFLDFIIDRRESKLYVFTSHFFRGPGRSVRQWQQWLLPPASSSFSALPSSPDPLRPTPHRRRVPMVAKRKPRRFSSMALFREYDINTHAVTARTKFQTLKLQKKHLTTAHWGGADFSYLDGRRGTERSGRLAFCPRIDSESFWRDTSNATCSCNFSHKSRIDVSAGRLAPFVCTYPLSSSLQKMFKGFLCLSVWGHSVERRVAITLSRMHKGQLWREKKCRVFPPFFVSMMMMMYDTKNLFCCRRSKAGKSIDTPIEANYQT